MRIITIFTLLMISAGIADDTSVKTQEGEKSQAYSTSCELLQTKPHDLHSQTENIEAPYPPPMPPDLLEEKNNHLGSKLQYDQPNESPFFSPENAKALHPSPSKSDIVKSKPESANSKEQISESFVTHRELSEEELAPHPRPIPPELQGELNAETKK